mmetsp:Transcript_20835/g.48294  ORF Transcript_20835/g.48294 Transcript_20835/m.48294 type:complete len:154 (-) Transcript_20835:58-519(-)
MGGSSSSSKEAPASPDDATAATVQEEQVVVKEIPKPPNAKRGSLLFRKYCKQCHTFQPEGRGTTRGPNLHGVFGTRSGFKTAQWGASDPRLIKLKLVWTEEVFKAWLACPQAFFNSQVMVGDRSCMAYKSFFEETRDQLDLIAFLKTANEKSD